MSEIRETELLDIVVIVQTLLRNELREQPMTLEMIRGKVDFVMSTIYKKSSVDKAKVEEELIRRFSTWIESPSVLSDDADHVEWLTADNYQDRKSVV